MMIMLRRAVRGQARPGPSDWAAVGALAVARSCASRLPSAT